MRNKDCTVVCCGHAAWDMNFIMDDYPVEDEKYRIDKLVQSGGGPAANAASLLAKWGVRAAYAGVVGDDPYGRLIADELEAWGVDTSALQIDAEKATPVSAVIVNTANGSRTLLNRRNPGDQPKLDEATTAALSKMNPAVLHFDGHALKLSRWLAERFPAALKVMDAGSYTDAADELCSISDYIICSRRFAAEVCGREDFLSKDGADHCGRTLFGRYNPGEGGGKAAAVVVTMGADGMLLCGKDGASRIESFKTAAVDSTAAGDIFHAAFSWGLCRRKPLDENLRFAAAAAAVSVGRPGGKPSIPALSEVEDFLASV